MLFFAELLAVRMLANAAVIRKCVQQLGKSSLLSMLVSLASVVVHFIQSNPVSDSTLETC